jgi:hypothetical protein
MSHTVTAQDEGLRGGTYSECLNNSITLWRVSLEANVGACAPPW